MVPKVIKNDGEYEAALARVDQLMSQDWAALQAGTFSDTRREQIVNIALEHRIMTQFTSFVAVEDRIINEGGTQHTVTVPVEMPEGVRYEGVFGMAAEADTSSAPARGAYGGSFAAEGGGGGFFAFGAAPMAAPRQEKRLVPPPVQALTLLARQRLAPELQALLEGNTEIDPRIEVVGGEVKIKIVLRDTSAPTLDSLQKAGLHPDQIFDHAVIGRIPVEKLAVLAELDGVGSITLPE